MKKICVAELNIELDFFFEKDFSLEKYETNQDCRFSILSKDFQDLPEYDEKMIEDTEYYSIFHCNGKRLQIQKMNQTIVGAILYDSTRVYLYLKDKSYPTEYLLSQYAFLYFLEQTDAIIFHGSSFIYDGKGILLTAPSGTGKSTHARLWRKYEEVITINDDKNAIRIKDGRLHMYGSPWSGKHHLDNNVEATLDFVVILYQNKENVLRRMKKKEAFLRLVPQLAAPTEANQNAWNQITDQLLELPIFLYGCNMEKEAVTVLKKGLVDEYAIN